ncbi:MAG: aminoglycoside phosphotransferase family protein [Acidimicrobiia bacterium]|nr:aminoglycoside phosphotransferase family protein [Acidimicrobiia bacterium]
MHADEIETDEELVRELLAGQFPSWAHLPVVRVESYGTDHDIYRLGNDLVVRIPRIASATAQAAKEGEWLPQLAPHLPLAVPDQVVRGRPTASCPHEWSIYTWLQGQNANGTIVDRDCAARDLAAFVRALRSIDTTGAHTRPAHARGSPLAELDDAVRRAIVDLADRIDASTVLRSWDESVTADLWSGGETWVHGDLLPGNLLVVDGRLSAIIDWGTLQVGDPACDLQPAWNVFSGPSRETFRRALDVDEASWLRGRGWALYQAISALAYYWNTNPGIIRQAHNALREVLGAS